MDAQSPPKRMTRARAARATESSSRKVVTATSKAAKAAVAGSSSVASTTNAHSATNTTSATNTSATKRKTRADETDVEDERDLHTVSKAARPTRGRPRKVAGEDAPAPELELEASVAPRTTTTTRGRPKKTTAATVPGAEPATRGRSKKTAAAAAAAAAEAQHVHHVASDPATATTATIPEIPVTKNVRVRAGAGPTAKPAITANKKTVTFQEPEKENVVPVTKSTTTTTSAGALRSRPPRKTASANASSSRTNTTGATTSTTTTTSSSSSAKPNSKTETDVAAKSRTTTAATAGRATRSRAASGTSIMSEGREKTPLSPKKVTQMPVSSRDSSEDELAAPDKTIPQTRSILKGSGPVRLRVGTRGGVKNLASAPTSASAVTMASTVTANGNMEQASFEPSEERLKLEQEHEHEREDGHEHDGGEFPVETNVLNAKYLDTDTHVDPLKPEPMMQQMPTISSPAKRPPQSPYRDSMKSPAKRVDGIHASLAAIAATPLGRAPVASPFKKSLLQTPARRHASPVKQSFVSGSALRDGQSSSSASASLFIGSTSLFGSPAKRSLSVIRPLLSAVVTDETSEDEHVDEHVDADEQQVEEVVATQNVEVEAKGEEMAVGNDDNTVDNETDNDMEHDTDNDVDIPAVPEHIPEDIARSIASTRSPTPTLQFPGRLSSVLPRHADPVISGGIVVLNDAERHVADTPEADDVSGREPIMLDEKENEHQTRTRIQFQTQTEDHKNQQQNQNGNPAPVQVHPSSGLFGLGRKDLVKSLHGVDSEEEEEEEESDENEENDSVKQQNLSRNDYHNAIFFSHAQPSPSPSPIPLSLNRTHTRTPNKPAGDTNASDRRQSCFGFTPLADQLRSWSAHSPAKKATATTTGTPTNTTSTTSSTSLVASTPTTTNTFLHGGPMQPLDPRLEAEMVAMVEAEMAAKYGENDGDGYGYGYGFDDVAVTAEDMDLAAEAREMSLLEPGEVVDRVVSAGDDAESDASQEYGDENQIPLDPAMFATPPQQQQRVMVKTFATTSKVPLKPAGIATPSPPKRRNSVSVSRARRTSSIAATNSGFTVGTPTRTPRRDVNTALLRGVVVHVDVRTSDGADASGVFVDLLTHMGARCLKTWTWNPTSPMTTTKGEIDATGMASASASATPSKPGITHVVFKDGSPRTLGKVRQSGGVVQCVGVGWVLDCESENRWLDESPYHIDASLAPRRPSRRRKSMEPKTLANLNGSVVSSGAGRAVARDARTVPNTPMNRRDSSVWVRSSPEGADDQESFISGDEDEDDDHGHDDNDNGIGNGDRGWDEGFLMPVPATPAPEAVARYAAQLGLATPSPQAFHGASDDDDDDDDGDDDNDGVDGVNVNGYAGKGPAVPKTCPPKKAGGINYVAGLSFGARDRGQGVVMRLMAARRKSLQFAPKIGSPLARAWK